jgi:hypothetical protein
MPSGIEHVGGGPQPPSLGAMNWGGLWLFFGGAIGAYF